METMKNRETCNRETRETGETRETRENWGLLGFWGCLRDIVPFREATEEFTMFEKSTKMVVIPAKPSLRDSTKLALGTFV